jgi:hypothetical protein
LELAAGSPFRRCRDRRTAEAAPVRAYQRSDEGQPSTVVTALHDARKRVRPLLAEAVP